MKRSATLRGTARTEVIGPTPMMGWHAGVSDSPGHRPLSHVAVDVVSAPGACE